MAALRVLLVELTGDALGAARDVIRVDLSDPHRPVTVA